MGILRRSCRTSGPLLYHCRRRRNYFSAPKIFIDKPTLLNCNTRISLPLSHSDALSFFARNYSKTSRKTKDSHIKRQVKENESDDYRMNGQITADPIRLVTDTGHQIISRREALDYAKKLNLDLVEVQFTANPPVCKVMDYNLEKFNQKQRQKERAKIKAEGLRKDDCREIRFTAKTEQRDLERKAEIAKQLMDRGCRVKCMAMGAGQQILEEQLQRFLILIENVSNVEFGPKIEQRNGYFIARHIKFGVSNKKEALQTIKSVENGTGKTERDNIKKTSVSEKKKEDTAVSPKEEFVEKSAQFEEHAPVEQFEEIVDEFPSIDTAEAISNGIYLPTRETTMHTANTIQQQDSVVGDINHYSETQTYLEYSSRNHDSLDQAKKALADTCSVRHRYDSSNIEQQFTLDQSLEQCRDPTKVEAAEFLKKEHFSLHLSTNLNNGPEEHQHGISDSKLSESASREVIFGRIHSDQGHFSANVGMVHSADSHFKANVKDIPDDYHIDASTTSEVTKTSVEELQTTHDTLNNSGATQEQQPRAQILADSLRQVLVKHSSGDQHMSKTEKLPLSDFLLKQANESRWAVLRQVKPSRFDDNTNTATPSRTTNFVEKLQTSLANLNNDTMNQVQQKITGSSEIPADDQEESASKERMQPLTNMLSKQADEFQWATFRQVKTSHFEGDNNTGRQDELGISNAKHHANQGHHVSNIGKQIPVSSVSLRTRVLENGASFAESGVTNGKQPTPSEHEKQGYFDPNKAIQKQIPVSSVSLPTRVLRNGASYTESGVANGKQPTSEHEKQGYFDPNKAIQKQIPVSSVSLPTRVLGNGASYTESVVENGKQPTPSEHEKQGHFDPNKAIQKHIPVSSVSLRTRVLGNGASHAESGVANGKQPTPSEHEKQGYFDPNKAIPKQIPVSSVSLPTRVLGNGASDTESGVANGKQPTPSEHEKQGYFDLNKAIQKQIPVSSVSLPTRVLGNGASYTESGVANAKQPTPSEHQRQGYFDPNKAIPKPLDSTPKLDNNTGYSNAKSRASLRILDAKTIPLVDTRQVPSYESPSGEGNHASSTGKQYPTDSYSKQVSTPVGSRWGIFSQPKGYVAENQRYPAKATEEESKDWSGVLEGPNTGASAEAQSDAVPRHLHFQNQRKVPTSSMGIGKQDQKQTVRDAVDQPRQKSWGIFSMKVPTKVPDDKGKSEV